MTKPRFGIDLDGVVYNWSDTYRFLMRYYRGIDLPEPDSWDAFDEYISEADRTWIWTEGVKHGLFRYGHLYKGSAEALLELARLVDLVVITHRPANAMQDTLEWLAFQKFPAVEIHLLTSQQPKSAVPCDFYLDDGPHNIEELRLNRPHARIAMWRRPWNRNAYHFAWSDKVRIVTSWNEVIEWVKMI